MRTAPVPGQAGVPGRAALAALLALTAVAASPAAAQCRMAGAGAACAEIRGPSAVPTDLGPGPYAVGETVPRTGAGTILHQPWYYGLPRAEGAWIYLRVEDDVYRVSVAEYRVIERVTPRMRRWWDDPVGSYAQPERPPRGPLPQIGASDGS